MAWIYSVLELGIKDRGNKVEKLDSLTSRHVRTSPEMESCGGQRLFMPVSLLKQNENVL
uniref:Uncharacterized protein n=1 Tax=Arion vulgaris TaxID=1028688 RepID=A0A0B7BZ73_9EUPU